MEEAENFLLIFFLLCPRLYLVETSQQNLECLKAQESITQHPTGMIN